MTKLILRFSIISFFVIASTAGAWGQTSDELLGITARPKLSDKQIQKAEDKAKVQGLSLPIFDDFSYRSNIPNVNIWEDRHVHINTTMGKNPISIGVATFDGLNQYGQAYDIHKITSDTADVLTSKGIDLSAAVDTVVLSFYYQPEGGIVETPTSEDYLALYFYAPDEDEWSLIWSVEGTGEQDIPFTLVQQTITDAKYLKDDFKFRFLSYGSQAGAFDMWHLDYVRLRDNMTLATDSTIFDPAFTKNAPSLLLNNYTAVPWFHYPQNFIGGINKESVKLQYRRSFDASIGFNLGEYRIKLNGTTLSSKPQNFSLDEDHTTAFALYDFDNPINDFPLPAAPTDEFELVASYNFVGLAASGLEATNDTLVHRQVFRNYYAYDDGTAEKIYQIPDNDDGIIVCKYDIRNDVPEPLWGLYIYFLPGEFDVVEGEFSIVVFDNVNGRPGNLLYESDTTFNPQISSTNFYLPYAFLGDDVPMLDGTVFIGIRQKNNVPLTIGFDVNNGQKTEIFYGPENFYYQSFQPGVLMMRPILRYEPKDIGQYEWNVKAALKTKVFPNPNNGVFNVIIEGIEDREIVHYQLYSIEGKLMQEGELIQNRIEASSLDKGVYILNLQSSDNQKNIATQKIMIAH